MRGTPIQQSDARHRRRPRRDDPRAAIAESIAQAVASNNSEATADPPHNGETEVVMALEMDGRRYVVTVEPLSEQTDADHVGARASATPELSAREHEIARMAAKGYTNKTIAAVLEISTWTVGTHLRRIFAKLDVHSRAAMVGRLAEIGALGDAGLDIDGGKFPVPIAPGNRRALR